MDYEEREEVLGLLREELREFISWTMAELGGEYFLEDPEKPVSSWEEIAKERVTRRVESERLQVWERDRYSFFDHPRHPAVYQVIEAEDLEIVHYLEEFYCDHYRVEDESVASAEGEDLEETRFEESFGVLLASQTKGWMYRLDFCDVCGLIEVWSMKYEPGEIAQYTGEE